MTGISGTKVPTGRLRSLFYGLVTNKDLYIAAAVTMILTLTLILVQKAMLSDTEFVTLSIVFASASFIAVIAQLGDDADVLATLGIDLARTGLHRVVTRVVLISAVASLLSYFFNDAIRSFGLFQFLAFASLFSLANWCYNLRRGQALMRHDNVDFRNTSLFCAIVRLVCFAVLVPFIGQYAILSEVIARIFLLPATSKSEDDTLHIASFTTQKFIRSGSYSTDSLVQSQALTAVSMIAATNNAATMILALRLMFYGTGALSQIVGIFFNRAIFQRQPLSFAIFMIPGLAFALSLVGGIWLIHVFGGFEREEAVGAIAVVFAFLTFPSLHPLSRIFTAVDREWIKLVLQLVYCGMVVWVASIADTLWPVVEVTAAFSVCYAVIFLMLVRKYRYNLGNSQGDSC